MSRIVGLLFIAVALALLPQAKPPDVHPVYNQFVTDKNRFHQQLQHLADLVRNDAPADSLRAAFRQSRNAYKRIEWLLEYYQPFVAMHTNGPPVAEVEENEPGQNFNPATGLQVMEPYLFPVYDLAQKQHLAHELTLLLAYTARIEQSVPANRLSDADLMEAVRMQLFRLLTLGITGYDAPVARSGLAEAAVTLRTLHDVWRLYAARLPSARVISQEKHWSGAILSLERAATFDAFDRVTFIREQLYPLCRDLQQARQILSVLPASMGHFLSPAVATLSDSGAFRPDQLTLLRQFASTPRKVILGLTLFYEPLLSGNNARSCASCHQPERGFTDGQTTSRAFGSGQRVGRNAPTLLNAGLQRAQFYDSRVVYLEEQAHDVLKNDRELRTSPREIIEKLSASNEYKRLFGEAFADGLTAPNVRNALACYVRSLTSLNARPDRYLRGEAVALSTAEKLGFNLFMGKARCATCHFFPIYNGFTPPHYEKSESEIIGVPGRRKKRGATLDPDAGKFGAFQKDLQRFAFKTPTVRNVALTAPYMHNGAYRTLAQVVDFYNRGGGRGIGIQLDGQTLAETPLGLSRNEQKALVTFLNALTDTTGLLQRPGKLPAVEGHPDWNRRKPGGTY